MSSLSRTCAPRAFRIALFAFFILHASFPICTAADAPAAVAARNRALVAKFADSLATVRFYTKKNADGDEPSFKIPYKCPNCGETHWRDGAESSERGIPAEFAGFVVGPDRVLMQDIAIPPEFVARIEVVCAGETVGAAEHEWSPTHDALVLKTERPLAKAKPLVFADGGAPAGPRYFFLVREEGESVAGVAESKATEFRHHVEAGKDIYEGNPNTLVLNGDDEPVTIALQKWVELGQEVFSPPATWEWKPAAARFEAVKELESRLARSVLPVYLQLEAQQKDEGRGFMRMRWSSSGEASDDIDAVGLVLEKGVVLIPASLKPEATARLVKIEATLPDGRKAPLEFVGSYDKHGAIAAKFADGVPQGVEPLAIRRGDPLSLFCRRFDTVSLWNRGGRLKFSTAVSEVREFERGEGNETLPVFSPLTAWTPERRENRARGGLVIGPEGVVDIALESRRERSWSRSGDGVRGSELAALVDAPSYDAENVPRASGDRKRTAWLGVETQPAGPDIVREKKAASFIGSYVERAPLVAGVASNSPAASAGIQEGDILLSARFPGGDDEERLQMDSDYGSMIDWSKVFDHEGFLEAAAGADMPTPWPNVESGVNAVLTREFGVGAEVVVAWVRDGRRMEATVRLGLAPVHYQNAPRARSKTLGVTVADMTHEVRKYFKFGDDASGVVVAKVKGGGPAAVAGLKPLELITQVNGEDVKDAKDFLAKVKDQKELTFSVRRLTATRVVPIKLQ